MIPIHRPKISSTQDTVHNSRQPHANLGRVGHLHPVWARTIHRVHSSRAAENHPESIFTIAHAFSSTEQSQQWRDDECRDRQTRSDEDHASSPRHRISWKRPGQPIDTGVQGAVSRPASGCAHYILGRTIGSGATSSRYQVLRGTVPSPSIPSPSPDRPLNRYPKTPKQPRSSEENYRDRSGMFSFNLDGLRSIRARLAVTRCFQAPSPGVYTSSTGKFTVTGTVTLDAKGDPSARFIGPEPSPPAMTAALCSRAGPRPRTSTGVAPATSRWVLRAPPGAPS